MVATPTRPQYARTSPETDLASPTFDANQYLAVTHACTSLTSLQNELKELKRTTSDKTEQLKALVSAHFDQYLSCHEAVRALAEDIRTHNKDNDALVADMKSLKQVTDSTLSVMLRRAKEQRKIRNTIAVLQRFRPIFEITTKMKEALQQKDYEKLAEDYCRLKIHHAKTNVAALQPVLSAAHELAQKANNELLQHFDDVSLSVKDQKRAIAVLEAIGLVEKPRLVCLRKQFEFLKNRLSGLQQSAHESSNKDPEQTTKIITECATVIYRFRSGLWGFICDLFKPQNSSGTLVITSIEAESIQRQAWDLLLAAVDLIEHNISIPTVPLLRQLNESFREINSLKKCPQATLLTVNIEKLKGSFCDKFRIQIVIQFLQQVCTEQRQQLLNEYFENTVNNQALISSKTKAARLIAEACDVFDELRNTSMISSESTIHLFRASVLTSSASDVMKRWENVWNHVGTVLLEMVEGMDEVADVKSFRAVISTEFKAQLLETLSTFLETLFTTFTSAISAPTVLASVAGSIRNRQGASACVLFAIVSNCIELREKYCIVVEQWISQLLGSSDRKGHTSDLKSLTLQMEAKCVEKYVQLHSEPLLRVLRAGAAEQPQQARSSSSSRTDSLRGDPRTNSSSVLDFSTVTPVTSLIAAPSTIPQDCRQYVFNVLLQLITLRSEVETSFGMYPQCPEYVRMVSYQLTRILADYLKDAVGQVETATEPMEWRRIHLLVEIRFFMFVLTDLMTNETKILLVTLEKTLEKTKASDKAIAAHGQLLAQLKHQTKLYLLALQQSS